MAFGCLRVLFDKLYASLVEAWRQAKSEGRVQETAHWGRFVGVNKPQAPGWAWLGRADDPEVQSFRTQLLRALPADPAT